MVNNNSSLTLRRKTLWRALFTVSCIAAFALPHSVQAQSVDDERIEEIVTIGSRVKGRSITETAVPIDIISSDALERIGQSETARMIQILAPSFNFGNNTISDGSDIARPATLRGLGPDQVLVLINGKRHISQSWLNIGGSLGAGSTGVDINSIPPAAIKRIEILRDGAAAQYGSDAIAGVINIVLKTRNEGTEIVSRWGQTYDDDGDNYTISINQGFNIGESGFVNLTFERRDRGFTNRADVSNRTFTAEGATPTAGTRIFRIGDSDSGNYQFMGNAMMPIGEGDMQLYAFGKITDRDGLSAGFFRHPFQLDRAVRAVFPDGHRPDQTTQVNDAATAAGIRGSIGDSFWTFDASVNWGRNRFGFGAVNTINASIAAGFADGRINDTLAQMNQMTFDGLIADVIAMQDPLDLAELTQAQIDAQALRQVRGDIGRGISDEEIAANAGPTQGFSGAAELQQLIFNFDITGQVESPFDSPLYIAVGFEARKDTYNITSGDLASFSCGDSATPSQFKSVADFGDFSSTGTTANCGFQGFPGYTPNSAAIGKLKRNNVAVYIDLEANITPRWLVTGAVRYENYDEIGDRVSGKFATRFAVNDQVALRASFATGFRVASLPQLGFTSTVTQAGPEGLSQTLIAQLADPFTQSLGIEELDFETSRHVGAGFVLTNILPRTTLTVDAFQIEIDNRITLGAALNLDVLRAAGLGASADILESRTIGQARAFFNAIDTRTRGVDLVATNNTDLFGGFLNTTLAYSFTKTTIQNKRAPGNLDPDIFFKPADESLVEDIQPHNRATASFDYTRGIFGSILRLNYWGETSSKGFTPPDLFGPGFAGPVGAFGINNNEDIVVNRAITVDWEVRTEVNSNLTLAIGANNIFNKKPNDLPNNELIRAISDGAFFGGPPNVSFGNFKFPLRGVAYGINGGFYYARANLRF